MNLQRLLELIKDPLNHPTATENADFQAYYLALIKKHGDDEELKLKALLEAVPLPPGVADAPESIDDIEAAMMERIRQKILADMGGTTQDLTENRATTWIKSITNYTGVIGAAALFGSALETLLSTITTLGVAATIGISSAAAGVGAIAGGFIVYRVAHDAKVEQEKNAKKLEHQVFRAEIMRVAAGKQHIPSPAFVAKPLSRGEKMQIGFSSGVKTFAAVFGFNFLALTLISMIVQGVTIGAIGGVVAGPWGIVAGLVAGLVVGTVVGIIKVRAEMKKQQMETILAQKQVENVQLEKDIVELESSKHFAPLMTAKQQEIDRLEAARLQAIADQQLEIQRLEAEKKQVITAQQLEIDHLKAEKEQTIVKQQQEIDRLKAEKDQAIALHQQEIERLKAAKEQLTAQQPALESHQAEKQPPVAEEQPELEPLKAEKQHLTAERQKELAPDREQQSLAALKEKHRHELAAETKKADNALDAEDDEEDEGEGEKPGLDHHK